MKLKRCPMVLQNRPGSSVAIRAFTEFDISILVKNFAGVNWPKPLSTFETYLQEQKLNKRVVWTALHNDEFADQNKSIPEIMDFTVLPVMRNKCIG
ncbi:MAG: hypothetical protein PV340_03460 [Wolbachia sp.]|nr:hypothetical protein [Wolbachia sp.]MDD9336625.1 hypothetical protein [Wolbachia sp.]